MASYILFFLVLTQHVLLAQSFELSATFNVVDYGARGDGYTDDSQAFMDAWKATCKSKTQTATMLIPYGKTFLLQPLKFDGRCRSNNIIFQIDGKLIAPSDPYVWQCKGHRCKQWIEFKHFDGLVITGFGTIDGRGSDWWSLSCKYQQNPICHHKKPTGIVVSNSNDVTISEVTLKDSPQMHMALERSTKVTVSNLHIEAPGDSPNTDGIHIQHSNRILIDHSQIRTGDDCVSIGDGSSHLLISNILCGPGHGISIGSLGKDGDYETVEHVQVMNATFTGTQNGVRIKTWQGGRGYAKHIAFEHITSYGSSHPIVIDQYYCPHEHCQNKTSSVRINDVIYNDISGTSMKQTAVKLACSETTPCTHINMKDINLRSIEDGANTQSYCYHVKGRRNRNVFPFMPCLSQDDSI